MKKLKKLKPDIEIQLMELQQKYLETRDPEIYKKMFGLLIPYARSLVLKTIKGKIFLPPDMIEDIAIEASIKFMNQYSRKEWFIATSFGGVLQFKILESLYNPRQVKEEMVLSLNQVIENSRKSNSELGDLPQTLRFSYMFRPDEALIAEDPFYYAYDRKKEAIQSALSVVEDLFISSPPKDALKLALGVLHFIRKRGYAKYYKEYLTDAQKEALECVLIELHNRLAN